MYNEELLEVEVIFGTFNDGNKWGVDLINVETAETRTVYVPDAYSDKLFENATKGVGLEGIPLEEIEEEEM